MPRRLWTVTVAYALVWVLGFGTALALALRLHAASVPSTETALSVEVLGRIAHDALRSPAFLIDTLAALAVTLCLLAGAVALFSPTPFVERLALGAPRQRGARGAAWIIAATLGASVAGLAASLVVDARSTLVAALSPSDAPLLIAVLAPAAEEIFFRGMMQTRLEERWRAHRLGGVPAVVVTALAAALLHLDPRQMFFVFVFGLALSTIRWRSGSVWPSTVAHVVNNGAWVLFARA